ARECERFVAACLKADPHVYLLVSRLVQETDDKEKQAQAFRLLELLFARSISQSLGRDYLEKLVLAKQMWERNVSFQNALEYMVLQLKNRR
ncbi:MAG: DNA polymerase III subunit delta', partial [Streptococcus sp.]